MYHRNLFVLCLVAGLIQACFHDEETGNPPEMVVVSGFMPYSMQGWEAIGRLEEGFIFGTDSYDSTAPDPYYRLGNYIGNSASRPFSLFIETTGGSYTEPADGTVVSMGAGDALRGVTAFLTDADVTLDVHLSYYTTIAEGFVKYQMAIADLMGFRVDSELFVSRSNAELSYLARFDVLSTKYQDTTDNSQVFTHPMNSETNLGLLLAGISQMTLDWSVEAGQVSRARPYTSIDFINVAYEDIAYDGVLDGKGPSSIQLSVGIKTIDSNTYRHDIAVALMRYVDNARNQTGFTREQMLSAALRQNYSTHMMYGGYPPIDLYEGGATIRNFMPARDSTVSGDSSFSVDLYCTTGLDQVEFFIDDVHYSYGSVPVSKPINLTSTSLFYAPDFQPAGTSGIHTVKVEATCVGGTVTSRTNTNVTFDNL
ncbi:MAG: hypothetical protein OEZ68_21410 [Gammaproteobacteria bacterium]|nr:hypothetical protein [Gammaproteobacteria bacterium]MDH5803360.1 hypothetical protein [Gammaproteobacteria bacterium]